MSTKTDSGTRITNIPEPGEWAIDKESDDTDLILIIDVTDVEAQNWVVHKTPPQDSDITVADYNPDYDENESVVIGAYMSTIDKKFDDWSPEEIVELYGNGLEERINLYSYPVARLKSASQEQ